MTDWEQARKDHQAKLTRGRTALHHSDEVKKVPGLKKVGNDYHLDGKEVGHKSFTGSGTVFMDADIIKKHNLKKKNSGIWMNDAKEEVQIDEISKGRLADYSKKAMKQTNGNQPHDPDKFRKRTNRENGIKTAFNKYHGYKSKVNATEEVEQIDEISVERQKEYERKAAKEIHTNPSKSFKRGMGALKSSGIRKSKRWDAEDGKDYKPRKNMNTGRDNKYYHNVNEGKSFSAFMTEIYEEVSTDVVSESTVRARVSKGAKRVQKLNGYFDRNKNTYHVGGKEIGHRDENGDDHFDVSFMKKHGIPELTNAHMD